MKNRQQDSFEEVVREICAENEGYVKQLYKQHRSRFMSWFMKQYRLNQQEVLEVYHQAFLVFYFQVKNQKLTTLASTIETYLFGIGKKLMLKDQSKERSLVDLSEVDVSLVDNQTVEKEELLHKRARVREILKKVPEPCKSILTLYYFSEFSLESIAVRLGYKNSGTVKKKKSLCLKQIRAQLVKKPE